MKKSLTILMLLCCVRSYAQQNPKELISAVLNAQELAWNKGDINAFMEGYWKSDSLLFVGKSGPLYGWEASKARYLRTYPGKESMGTLDFDVLKIEELGPNNYFVLGKWHMMRTVGDIGGTYTLIFRRINRSWLIVSDRTS